MGTTPQALRAHVKGLAIQGKRLNAINEHLTNRLRLLSAQRQSPVDKGTRYGHRKTSQSALNSYDKLGGHLNNCSESRETGPSHGIPDLLKYY